MRNILGVSAAALLVASCGGPDAEGTFETEDGESGSYSIDVDEGETNIAVTGEDGSSMTISAGDNANADLPDGFSLYPGATIVSNANISQDDGGLSIIEMQSSASPEDMVSHYRREAEALGVDIQMEVNNNDSVIVGGESADGMSFSFSASPNGGETTGQLTVARELGE